MPVLSTLLVCSDHLALIGGIDRANKAGFHFH